MAKRDILKEAIADAKAVKETAIANAKAALEEAFTPQLKSMLAAKLEEMEIDEEKEDIDEMTKKEKAEGDDRKPAKDEYKPEKDTVDRKMMESEDLDEEINLDEILAEIEGELTEGENIKEADESEAERADVDKYEYEEGKEEGEEEADDETEDEEIDLEDMTDDDLKGFIEDVIADMVGSGELEAGENFEEEDEDTEVEVGMEVDSEEEVELDEQFDSRTSYKGNNPYDTGEKSVSDDVKKALSKLVGLPAATMKKLTDYANSLEKDPKHKYKSGKFASVTKEAEEIDENQKLRRELKEAHATIKTQGSTLNEVNLLNAKLLYTNKIFRAKTLTESQKVKVLGAFDKASTVKETKLVFETLNEGLKTKRSPIQESLGSASKVTGNYKRTKNPIIETDPMVARFQKLAGLK